MMYVVARVEYPPKEKSMEKYNIGWQRYVKSATIEDVIRSRFISKLYEKIITTITETTKREVTGEISEIEIPEFKVKRIRLTFYVDDLDDRTYIDLRRRIFDTLVTLYNEFKREPASGIVHVPVGAISAFFDISASFDLTTVFLDEILRDVIKRLHIEILPRGLRREARGLSETGRGVSI